MDEEDSDPDFEYLTIDETDQADLLVYEDEDYVLDADGTLITREMASNIQIDIPDQIDQINQVNVPSLTDEDLAIFMTYSDGYCLSPVQSLQSPIQTLTQTLRELTTSMRSLVPIKEETKDPMDCVPTELALLIINYLDLTALMHIRSTSVKWRALIQKKLTERAIIFNIERVDEYAALFDCLEVLGADGDEEKPKEKPIQNPIPMPTRKPTEILPPAEAHRQACRQARKLYITNNTEYHRKLCMLGGIHRDMKWKYRWHVLTNINCIIYLDELRRYMKDVYCYPMEILSKRSKFKHFYKSCTNKRSGNRYLKNFTIVRPPNNDVRMNIYTSVSYVFSLLPSAPECAHTRIFCCFDKQTCKHGPICQVREIEESFRNNFALHGSLTRMSHEIIHNATD